MRELGASKVCAYGVSVEWDPTQSANDDASLGYTDDEEDAESELDGIPIASGPRAEAWLAQKAKQDAKRNAPSDSQPDLQQWYTARPLPSVD